MRNDKLSYQAKQKSLPKRFPKKIGVSAGDHSGEVFLSVIAPCFNELENIPVFLQEVRYHLENCCSFEVIFINDGSTDDSAILLDELADKYSNVQVLHFIRNFGQQAAQLAGIHIARGDVLVTMDSDLQHPPSFIRELIEHWEKGADVVYAVPEFHKDVFEKGGYEKGKKEANERSSSIPFSKKIFSLMYSSLFKKLNGNKKRYISSDFRLFDKEVADVIRQLPNRPEYIRELFSWICPPPHDPERSFDPIGKIGFTASVISYPLRSRQAGVTKYTTGGLMDLAIQGIVLNGAPPYRRMIRAGMVVLIALWILGSGFVIRFSSASMFFVGEAHPGVLYWMILMMAFTSFFTWIILWLLGEYMILLFERSRNRPFYIVRDSFIPHEKRSGKYFQKSWQDPEVKSTLG